jgi:hypothetical protein
MFDRYNTVREFLARARAQLPQATHKARQK